MTQTSGARVLVADDQADVLAALQFLLRDAGLTVDQAASVADIRDRLREAAYDLILMDLNYTRDTTSGREGLDLLAEILGRDRLLPVIVMTGWGTVDLAVEAMRRGARSFVLKPWDNRTLTDTVLHEIEDARAARHAHTLASVEEADAQAVQRALLPTSIPSVPGCTFAVRWEPALAFGGDCYDVLRLSETRLAVLIADVCGKGLPAALLMSNVLASVRAFSAPDRSAREVVSSTNRALCQHGDLRRFVTLFYAVYDLDTRLLTYSNAGHLPPIRVRRNGTCERLSVGGMVTGILADAVFEEGTIQLEPGDRLVLFTDGVTEARSGSGAEFQDDGLLRAIAHGQGRGSSALVDAVFEEVLTFAGGRLEDDATLLVADVT